MASNTTEYNKQYYEKTKDSRLEKLKEQVTCKCCDKLIYKSRITVHNKSSKHLGFEKIRNEFCQKSL
jgi:hypothetical protein